MLSSRLLWPTYNPPLMRPGVTPSTTFQELLVGLWRGQYKVWQRNVRCIVLGAEDPGHRQQQSTETLSFKKCHFFILNLKIEILATVFWVSDLNCFCEECKAKVRLQQVRQRRNQRETALLALLCLLRASPGPHQAIRPRCGPVYSQFFFCLFL